jgi:outer membrane lipoprotein-sorting protein
MSNTWLKEWELMKRNKSAYIARYGANCEKYIIVFRAVLLTLSIIFIAGNAISAEMPSLIKNHYRGQDAIYWKIKQITYSPVFEKSETLAVEFYIERPNRLFAKMPDRQIYSDGDTLWVYLPEDKQIQISLDGEFLNPFDFIDSAQSRFQVHSAAASSHEVTLLAIDETTEPDSLCVRYREDGSLKSAGYLDANENEIELIFIKETFDKAIPKDIFIKKLPKDIEIINLDE